MQPAVLFWAHSCEPSRRQIKPLPFSRSGALFLFLTPSCMSEVRQRGMFFILGLLMQEQGGSSSPHSVTNLIFFLYFIRSIWQGQCIFINISVNVYDLASRRIIFISSPLDILPPPTTTTWKVKVKKCSCFSFCVSRRDFLAPLCLSLFWSETHPAALWFSSVSVSVLPDESSLL